MTPMSFWRDDAACASADPEVFHPGQGQGSEAAKKICAACEVRPQCLADAIANDEREGIWGGLTKQERRKLARARNWAEGRKLEPALAAS